VISIAGAAVPIEAMDPAAGGWLLVAVLAVPLAGSLALLAAGAERGERLARPVGVLASGLTLVVAVAAAVVFDLGQSGVVQLETNARWAPAIDLRWHLGLDGISLPLVVLTALLTFLCMLYTTRILPRAGQPRGLVGLLLLLEVGLLGTFLALDLLLFFIFFEVVLLPMWFVIARWGDGAREGKPTAAANTFILYTVLGSAVMLVGILLVHAETGTFDLVALADDRGAGMARSTQVLAALLLLVGFAVKTPMWPLHTWLPDAHTAAPTVGSVLLAGALLKMGTYGLVRVVLPVVPEGAEVLAPYIAALGVVGILYGSLVCLVQTDLKRLIAYSSVGHMGFVLLGIATLTPAGVNGALFANIAHGLITGLLFFVVGGIKDRHGSADLGAIGRGLYGRAPRLGSLLTFGAIASLGLPGLAGFWGEMLAMFGAFDPAAALDRPLYLVFMSLAGVGTLLTAAYLLRVVRQVCQGPHAVTSASSAPDLSRRPLVFGDVAAVELAAWGPLVVAVLVLGLWPAALLGLTDPAVAAVLGSGG